MAKNEKATSSYYYAALPEYLRAMIEPEQDTNEAYLHNIREGRQKDLRGILSLMGCVTDLPNNFFYANIDGVDELIGGIGWVDVQDLYHIINREQSHES